MEDRSSHNPAPRRIGGYWTWPATGVGCQVFFVGKGSGGARYEVYRQVAPSAPAKLAWPRQVHSGAVREATQSGACGAGDALVTDSPSMALSVETADCVPVVVAGRGRLAVVHAGWRGLVHGIIEAALHRLGGDMEGFRAWIGPSIGVCCYEVSSQVAEAVAAASRPEIIQPRSPRPHIDLPAAARLQLRRGGVEAVTTLDFCTRCSADWLWSYRRDRPHVGRNYTFAWLEGEADPDNPNAGDGLGG